MEGLRISLGVTDSAADEGTEPSLPTNNATEKSEGDREPEVVECVREENREVKKQIVKVCQVDNTENGMLTTEKDPQQMSPGSVSGSGSNVAHHGPSSSKESQTSSSSLSCDTCDKNKRLVRERDETITALLSNVLQRLWAPNNNGERSGGDGRDELSMTLAAMGGNDFSNDPVPKDVGSSGDAERKLQLSSVRKGNDELLLKLLLQSNAEIRTLTEKNRQLELQLASSGSVPGGGGGTVQFQVTSSQESQAVSSSAFCASCYRKDRLLQERDNTIATLLSDVLRHLSSASRSIGDSIPGGAVDKTLEGIVPPESTEKSLELFDEVLKVLIRKQGLKPSNGFIDWRGQWPLILSCRGVCKSWKRSVDTLLENIRSPRELCSNSRISSMTYAAHYTPCPVKLEFQYNRNYQNDTRIPSFTAFFKKERTRNPTYNPIPSRHLKIDISCADPIDIRRWHTFSLHVLEYLKWFGPQVWYLTLRVCRIFSKEIMTRVYVSLRKWLDCLPNLKSLSYGIHGISFLSLDQKIAAMSMMSEDLHPAPQLNQLVTFQLEGDCVMGYHILKSNWQVQKLRLSQFVGENFAVNKVLALRLPNLSELSVSISRVEQMQRLGKAPWNLRKLILSFVNMERCAVGSVMNTLSKFKAHLHYLSLDLTYPGIFGSLGATPLPLPYLKYLRFQYTQENGGIRWSNFLKELKQLETLEIVMNQLDAQYSDGEMVTFLEYIDNVQGLRYWNNFPELRSVRLTVEVKRYGQNTEFQYFRKRRNMPTVKFDVKFSEKIDTQKFELHS